MCKESMPRLQEGVVHIGRHRTNEVCECLEMTQHLESLFVRQKVDKIGRFVGELEDGDVALCNNGSLGLAGIIVRNLRAEMTMTLMRSEARVKQRRLTLGGVAVGSLFPIVVPSLKTSVLPSSNRAVIASNASSKNL